MSSGLTVLLLKLCLWASAIPTWLTSHGSMVIKTTYTESRTVPLPRYSESHLNCSCHHIGWRLPFRICSLWSSEEVENLVKHTHINQKFLLKSDIQNVRSKFLLKSDIQNVRSKFLLKSDIQNVISKRGIYTLSLFYWRKHWSLEMWGDCY
jgi:hypothetical protein